MAIGPVQLLVVGFPGTHEFKGEILQELHALREADLVRLVDVMAVRKDAEGNIETLQASDLTQDEAMEFGAVVGALVGLGAAGEEGVDAGALAGAEKLADGHAFDEQQVWYLADAIPDNTAAAVALLEHRWMIGLRDAIVNAEGTILADEWVHPEDLVAIGMLSAAEAK